MTTLNEGALRFLENAFDERRALFSYSTQLRDGAYVHDFDHPAALRYSVNSLLGLQEAARHRPREPFLKGVDDLAGRFLEKNYAKIDTYADLGLLSVLLSERGGSEATAADALERIRRVVSSGAARRLTLQDVSWMLWGLVAATKSGAGDAEEAARALFRILHREFLNRDSLLARHSLNPLRSNLVSFGGTVYFLRALHEYATAFDDEYAETLFRFGVERVMGLQGRYGEWPWMIAVRSAIPVDVYPVFSVHQDSMAMLFLLPALDRGLPGTREAIERSLTWLLGRNEIGVSMVVEHPFFIYRSIERADSLAKPRRYVRGFVRSGLRRPAASASREGVRLNRECRSYHLGWILYAWSGRSDMPKLEPLQT